MAGIAIWKKTLVADMERYIARDTGVTFVGGVDAGFGRKITWTDMDIGGRCQ